MIYDQYPSKPHYLVLDGLRGVAALMVVFFHVMETHSTSHLDQVINHGYMAVDFFFILSGFVIGYAYDDRWGKGGMGLRDFFKRRLIRLHPMIVMGTLIGAALFYFQASPLWPRIEFVPLWKLLAVMAVGFTLLPLPKSWDIRGWHEMHPLNGPAWTLFYEYIANILYALFVRRFSRLMLSVLVGLAAAALVHMAVTSHAGDIVGGWALDASGLRIGFTRLLYPFFAGLLLFRVSKTGRIGNAFLWSSLLLVVLLCVPRIGGAEHRWANGLYESLAIIFVFPLIVWIGASSGNESARMKRTCKILGDLSYPLYLTHYPLIYLYTGWISRTGKSFGQAWPVALSLVLVAIAVAWGSLKLYDEPVRKWLRRKFSA